MKKRTKNFLITISLISIIVLGTVFIFNLFSDKNSNGTPNVQILYEIVEKRNEFSKVYKCSDGSYTAIMSATPFHYYENNEWKEIDNTLIKDPNDNYTNSANDFNVNLPVKFSADSDITVKQNDYSVAFSLNGTETKSKGKVENAKENNKMSNEESLLNKKSSSVTYKNVFTGTDIIYELEGKTLKENIIVDSFSDVKDSYEFTISLNNLTAILNSDKSVSFKNDKDEIVFSIPSPVMYDAGYHFSKEIFVSLEDEGDNTYSLTYTPDRDWLKSENRRYPVTIDPQVQAVGSDFIRCATVLSNEPDENTYNNTFNLVAEKVDENNVHNYAETYEKINLNIVQELLNNVTITEAQLVNACGAIGQFVLKEIDETCDLATVTYNTKPDLSSQIIDYYTAAENGADNFILMHFNITEYLSDLIAERKENNGVAITVTDECAENSVALLVGNAPANGVFSDVSGAAIIVNYIDTKGYDNRYSYHSQSMGSDGIAYVNDFTRHLFVSRNDFSLKNSDMYVSVSMQYNPALYNYIEFIEDLSSTEEEIFCHPRCYGEYWLNNYSRAIYINENSNYPSLSFATENGNVLTFYPKETTDEDGNLQVVFVEDRQEALGDSGYSVEMITDSNDESVTYFQVVRPDGNIEKFDQVGRLSTITSGTDSSKKIEIHYVSDLSQDNNALAIDYILDEIGRKYDFVYDDSTNLLSAIRYLSSNEAHITNNIVPIEITYEYIVSETGKNLLSKVTSLDGTVTTYEYDSNDRLIAIIYADNQKITYEYDSVSTNTVSKVIEWIRPDNQSAFNIRNTIEINSNGPFQTTFKTPTQTETYQFGKHGSPQLIYNNEGEYNNIENQKKNSNSTTSNYNNWNIISENYIYNSGFQEYFVATSTDAINWYNVDGDVALRTGTGVLEDSYCGYLDNSIGFNGYEQIVGVNNCDSATLSLYAKPGERQVDNNSFEMWCYAYNDNDEVVYYGHSTEFVGNNSEWKRYSVTASRKITSDKLDNEEVDYFWIRILTTDNTSVFIDNIQLEKHEQCSSYNLVTDSLFRYDYSTPVGWTSESDYQTVDATVNEHDYGVLKFAGGINNNYSVSQTIYHYGTKGETYNFGGWFNGNIVNAETDLLLLKENAQATNFVDNRYSRIKVEYTYTDENSETFTATEYIDFNQHMSDWQYAASSFELKGDCSEFVVSIEYGHHPKTAYFTGIHLSLAEETKQDNNKTDYEIIDELPETGYYCLYDTETNNNFDNAITMNYALTGEATYEIYGGFDCLGENKSNTSDNDYYKIKVNEDGELFIDGAFIDSSQTDFTLSFILLDANHKQVAGSTLNSYGTQSKILSSTLAPGEYVICVFVERANVEKTDAEYRLLLSFQPN